MAHLKIKYRQDIDGIRALAVVSVILFHFFPKEIPGGFIGVDIFFVISGFLISSIIFDELENGDFTIQKFYSRRANRIFPSLIVILSTVLVLGIFTLTKIEMKELGRHLFGGAFFISNFVNWGEQGYFSTAAEEKPLLHLWSLGIEEQFYIFFPFLMVLLYKIRSRLTLVLVTILLLSFFANLYFSYTRQIDAFYLPFNRVWELLIGVLGAIFCRQGLSDKKFIWNIFSIVGLTLIVTSIFCISEGSVFPGLAVLFPVVGTLLLLVSGSNAFFNREIFSNKLLVWIGLISYPLYLWHWPILSYWRIIQANEPVAITKLALILIIFGLTSITYYCIERPIRFGISSKYKTCIMLFAIAFIGMVGLGIHFRDGILSRSLHKNIKASVLENNALLEWYDQKTQGCSTTIGINSVFCLELGNVNNIQVAVLGDSTGNAIAPGLADLLSANDIGLINIGAWTCPPIRGLMENRKWGEENKCVATVDHAYNYVLQSKNIHTVVLAIFARDLQNWGIPGVAHDATLDQKFNMISKLLDRDISDLEKNGKKVVVTYDTPYFPVAANKCIPRPITGKVSDQCDVPESLFVDRQPYLEIFDNYFTAKKELCIVKQSNVLVANGRSRIVDESGKMLMRDSFHLSKYGSALVAQEFVRAQCLRLN